MNFKSYSLRSLAHSRIIMFSFTIDPEKLEHILEFMKYKLTWILIPKLHVYNSSSPLFSYACKLFLFVLLAR